MTGKKRYLFYFAQELLDFRYPEIESLAKLFNIDLELPASEKSSTKPFWILQMKENHAKLLASRSVMLRFVTELWVSGNNYNQFHDNLRKHQFDEKYKTESFKFRVESFNKTMKHQEKVEKIDTMSYLAFEGPIILKNPTNEFVYFEYYGLDPNHPELNEIFMGRLIAEGSRDLISSISLKTRKFIGNTSMAPELSLLMANQALCDKNQLAFDPFCGTGSMLIAAAMFGSYVIGSDIDYLMLHGKTRPSRISQKVREVDESVKANMEQYSLSHLFLDVFVGDFSICPFVNSMQFDSIICDPPYGIREAMAKLERKEPRKATVLGENSTHFPSLSKYKIQSVYEDILTYSAKHLKMNGRLVCMFPTTKSTYSEKIIPQHTALKLVGNSEQVLGGEYSRRLLTYEKISDNGEFVINEQLEGLNFREEFFQNIDRSAKYERGRVTKEKQIAECAKRGIDLPKLFEEKKNMAKKKFKE